MNQKLGIKLFCIIVLLFIIVLFRCTKIINVNKNKNIETIDINDGISNKFELDVENEEFNTKDFFISADKDTNKMSLFDKNENLIYKSKWYELEIIYDVVTGKPFMFLDIDYDADGGFVESYDMSGISLNIPISVKPLFVVNNYIIVENGMYKKEIYKYIDNTSIDFILKASDIDYDNSKFFVSYGADFEDSENMDIYNEELILLKSFPNYIYLKECLIGNKKFYKVGHNKLGYHKYNYIDTYLNLILDYPYNNIEQVGEQIVIFEMDYGKIEYDYYKNIIKNEYIYEGCDKYNFLKYINNIYNIVNFCDGRVYCIKYNDNYFLLNEKMKPITHNYKNPVKIENYWVRHRNDSIQNLIFSIYDGEKYNYYTTNKLFYIANSNKDFQYCNNGYYFTRMDNGVVLKNINNIIEDTYIEWITDDEYEPMIDTYLIKVNDRTYTLFAKYDGNNEGVKNESFSLYDEKFHKLDILINSSKYYIFNNYIAIYDNQNTKIFDEDFKLVKNLVDRYYEVYETEIESKTLYLFEKNSINGRWCDIYDSTFNLINSTVNLYDFIYKKISFK